ncbi:methyltransferase domain-containing protein [Knoellia subterranea]|uniref:Methyltransferase domain-containing protein n=1 Tax=Knoellia subterranea KCTC 19937 TaxID=1385521 RepID=A0A0A0JME9_9MICO|nr:methyltransferase domain-containing protein [Knoellia subterranea]KGN38318.1 hypothetical protein N803_09700 [Knoellia subterranea KCTC 19937]
MDCCSGPSGASGRDPGRESGREPKGYDEFFSQGFSRSSARRYDRRGLARLAGRVVDFLESRGIRDATVLEVGGGIGDLHVELLRRGAATATNLEMSTSYDADARALLERHDLVGRVDRRMVDIALDPEVVAPADVVVLNRVVCCYPDYETLLTAAGERAGSLLAFSHPTDSALNRMVTRLENAWFALRHQEFRTYAHDPEAMVAVVEATGLREVARHRGFVWSFVGFERPAHPAGS